MQVEISAIEMSFWEGIRGRLGRLASWPADILMIMPTNHFPLIFLLFMSCLNWFETLKG